MSEERQDSTNRVEEQETNEAESRDEQGAAALRRRMENVSGTTSTSAPVDDDVIIK